jgi:hypothetical protein
VATNQTCQYLISPNCDTTGRQGGYGMGMGNVVGGSMEIKMEIGVSDIGKGHYGSFHVS